MPPLKRRLSAKPTSSISNETDGKLIDDPPPHDIINASPESDDKHLNLDTSTSTSTSTSTVIVCDDSYYNYTKDEKAYLLSLSTIERKVCIIAQQHLETSFDLSRSSGFINWKLTQTTNK